MQANEQSYESATLCVDFIPISTHGAAAKTMRILGGISDGKVTLTITSGLLVALGRGRRRSGKRKQGQ